MAELDYRTAAGKAEGGYTPRFLRINKYFNRPLAWLLVRALARTPVTPNAVTYASFALAAAAAAIFLRGTPGAFLAAGLLTQLSSIVDCADGMLARARNRTSEFGAYLDLLLDRVGELLVFLGYVFGLERYARKPGLLILGLVSAGLYFFLMTVFYLTKAYLHDTRPGDAAENRAWLMAMIAVFAILNRMESGVYVMFAAASAGSLGLTIRFFFKRRPEAAAAPPAT